MRATLILGCCLYAVVARAEAPPAEVKGAAWQVRAVVPGRVQVGERAELEVVVEARAGFHLNDDYPINFRPATSDKASFERARIDKKDGIVIEPCAARGDGAHGCRARVPAAFVAETVGAIAVGGTIAFSACDASQCLIEKVAVAAPVKVQPKR